MFNLKKNLFLEGKMQSLCPGKYLRTLVFLGLSAAPFQLVSAQFNLSLANPSLGSVIKKFRRSRIISSFMMTSLLLFNLNL